MIKFHNAVAITYEDSEPDVKIFWLNLKTIDPYDINSKHLKCIILNSYFSLNKNKKKTLRDLELELRANNINITIVVNDIDKDTQKEIRNNKQIIIKPQYIHLYQHDYYYKMSPKEFVDNINHEHIAKYCASYSFDVKQHDNRFNDREKLIKLIDSGFLTIVSDILYNDTNNNILNNTFYNLENNKKRKIETSNNSNISNNIISDLINLKKRIVIHDINLKKIFNDCWQLHQYEGAEILFTDMDKNGPIKTIVKDGKILCDIGQQTYCGKNGSYYIKYIIIQHFQLLTPY
jgi:hypothetical protein